MKGSKFGVIRKAALMVAATALILIGSRATAPAAAQGPALGTRPTTAQEQVLYNFQLTGEYGRYSLAGLIRDSAGNLYGTTTQSGEGKQGTVFELSPQSGGGWTVKVLHHFVKNGKDGTTPMAGLTFDAAGNPYGTTLAGGSSSSCFFFGAGCGTVFELSPQSSGGWSEKVLYSFQGTNGDGSAPVAGVVFDSAGNLYGTTELGTDVGCTGHGCGIVFELSPQSGGNWSEKVLYAFTGGSNGGNPRAGLVLDAAGNLYGTAPSGGDSVGCNFGCGIAFELLRKSGGQWVEKTLHNFQANGIDGNVPTADMIFDTTGNLYGTTGAGGSTGTCEGMSGGCGTVFELSPKSGKGWSEKVLYSFLGNPDGAVPSGVVFDPAGNLYGTTSVGGKRALGTAFELSPQTGGTWFETVLHSFTGFHTDGSRPNSGVVLDPVGNLYGTSEYGGNGACRSGCGTVFEVTP